MTTPNRGILERGLGRFQARTLASTAARLVPIADDLWVLEGWQIKALPGNVLPCRSTVVRLATGAITLIGTPPISEQTRAALDALGPIRFIVAPNVVHHVHIPAWASACPSADLYLAPGLRIRRTDLPPGHDLDTGLSRPWQTDLDEVTFGPVNGFSEVVFFHRPSATLLTTDLCFNLTNAESVWRRVLWEFYGYPRSLGPSRSVRLMLLRHRQIARPALAKLFEWPFDRLIMAHGEIVEDNTRARCRAAFSSYLGEEVREAQISSKSRT